MPRDLPLGNGRLLVTFDGDYRLRDLYFPHVGGENHVGGSICRFGVFVDGRFSWVERDQGWSISMRYEPDTLVGQVEARHPGLGVALLSQDAVDFHEALYVRRVVVQNLRGEPRSLRIFFHQNFAISDNEVGDTAVYDPVARAVVHYKGSRYFLANLQVGDRVGVSSWAVGQKALGKEGTFRDAEDGELSRNPIAQGAVDSVVAADCEVPGNGSTDVHYWLAAGQRWQGVWDGIRELNAKVVERGPGAFLERTRHYWRCWVCKESDDFADLPATVVDLYRRSLLVLRTHVDSDGAVIAATDSDIVGFARDTYCYCWPRDGALVAHALDLAGYESPSLKFFEFCADRLTARGFLLHKYTASGQLGSSWHPWIGALDEDGDSARQSARAAGLHDAPAGFEVQLPIQEDETALVIWALWKHFERWRNVEAVRGLYGRLVKKAARFMAEYRDATTGLPGPSYDLWEERRGISAFTCGAVVGGLDAAARFASAFGEFAIADRYVTAANEIRQAMGTHLFRPELGRFARQITVRSSGEVVVDTTLDSSLYGVFAFGALPADDPRVSATMAAVRAGLTCRTEVGGMARYFDDYYHQVTRDLAAVPGNPWIICSLWCAQHAVATARARSDLRAAGEVLSWVEGKKLASGVLPEQLHPYTGSPLSVSPLTWSHAAFVICVQQYLARYRALAA